MMSDREIKRILRTDLEIPEVVDIRIQNALETIGASAATAQPPRKKVRILKRTLLIAAVIAILSAGTALAAYVSGENSKFYQAFFGNTVHESFEARVEYDSDGRLKLNAPNIERVPVDEEKAEELVGKYLTEGGVYSIKSYTGVVTTVTIESLLYDYNTGAFLYRMCLERESGGFPELPSNGVGDEVYFNGEGLCLNGEWSPGAMYLDRVNSTENKVFLNCAGINWRAGLFDDSEMSLNFNEYADMSKVVPEDLEKALGTWEDKAYFELEKINLQKTEGLPAETVASGGKTAAIFSAAGIRMYYDALGIDYPDPGFVDYVALEYSDGTRYVVSDDVNSIYNANYALGAGPDAGVERAFLTYCFNRVVDTEQVAKIIINDIVLAVG